MQRHRSIAIFRPMLFITLVLALLPLAPWSGIARAQSSTLHIRVVSARTVNTTVPFHVHVTTGQDLCNNGTTDCATPYKFLIVKDDTGDPTQPKLPNCLPQSSGGLRPQLSGQLQLAVDPFGAGRRGRPEQHRRPG